MLLLNKFVLFLLVLALRIEMPTWWKGFNFIMEELLWSESLQKRDGMAKCAKVYIYPLKYLSITSSFENGPIHSQ